MNARLAKLGVVVVVGMLAGACGSGDGDSGNLDLPPRGSNNATDDDSIDAEDTTEETPEATGDSDGDGIPDDQDCDPQNAEIAGTRLFDEVLTADAQKFSVADGFPAASWTYAEEAYRQVRLADASDVTFFAADREIDAVDVEVRAASTEFSNAITPIVRQMFVLVGATMNGGSLSAYGCGIEVLGSGASAQRTTAVVKLEGPADNVVTTAIQRTPRTAVQANEDFSLRAQVTDGKITCTTAQAGDAITTAEGTGLTIPKGAIGFFTRQTKAAWKSAKICKLKASSNPN